MLIPRIYRLRWDWVILACAVVLIVVGFLAIHSATHHPDSPRQGYIWRHLVAFFLGLAVFAFCLLLPLRLWEDWAWLFYGAAMLLLVVVLFLGVDEYGARRWFRLGFLRFQPAEFAKLALIVTQARYLAGKRVDLTRPTHLVLALALAVIPFALVMKQPDLGTAGAFLGLTLPMLIWAGIPRFTLLALLSPLLTLALMHYWWIWVPLMLVAALIFWRSRLSWVIVGGFLVFHLTLFFTAPHVIARLHPYQQARITTFLNPESDPTGAGYQVLQSKIALGSGQLFGKGYLKGTQNALSFLPQQHTDFIYSVVGEEWGFFGCAIVVLVFLVLCLRVVHVARHCRSAFGSFVAVGVCGLIFYHAALNMAMTMGLFPVTGLPLPFVSYGGSFLIAMMGSMGQLENVAVHRYEY